MWFAWHRREDRDARLYDDDRGTDDRRRASLQRVRRGRTDDCDHRPVIGRPTRGPTELRCRPPLYLRPDRRDRGCVRRVGARGCRPVWLPSRRAVLPCLRAASRVGLRRPTAGRARSCSDRGRAVRVVGRRAPPSARARPAACRVVFTACMARELGGGRRAQLLAALAAATSAEVLATVHLLSTAAFDLFFWSAITFLMLRLLRTGDERWWLAIGAVTGVGLLNKYNVAFLLVGLAVGLVGSGHARMLASRWLWVGAAHRARDLGTEPDLERAPRLGRARNAAQPASERTRRSVRRSASFPPKSSSSVRCWSRSGSPDCADFCATRSHDRRSRVHHAAWCSTSRPARSRTTSAGSTSCCSRPVDCGSRNDSRLRRRSPRRYVGAVRDRRDRRAPADPARAARQLARRRDLGGQHQQGPRVRPSAGSRSCANSPDVVASLPPSQRAHVVIFTGDYGAAGAIDLYGARYRTPTRDQRPQLLLVVGTRRRDGRRDHHRRRPATRLPRRRSSRRSSRPAPSKHRTASGPKNAATPSGSAPNRRSHGQTRGPTPSTTDDRQPHTTESRVQNFVLLLAERGPEHGSRHLRTPDREGGFAAQITLVVFVRSSRCSSMIAPSFAGSTRDDCEPSTRASVVN